MSKKGFFIFGSITMDLAKQFAEFCYENSDSQIDIWIYSNGGGIDGAEMIITIINDNPSRFIINAVYNIYSCAFDIFFYAKCGKRVIDGCNGMIHKAKLSIETQECGRVTDEEAKVCFSFFDKSKENRLNFYRKLGFTEKEISDYNKGKNLYFDSFRLNEFVINQIK